MTDDYSPPSRTPLAFGLSALLHGAVAGLVLWSFWQVSRAMTLDARPSAHVFTMVDAPDSAPAAAAPGPVASNDTVAAPSLGPSVQIEPVSLPPEIAPAPVAPPTARNPAPQTPARNSTPAPAPARSTTARSTAPTREPTNYQEFLRSGGPPRPSRSTTPAAARGTSASRGVPNVGINTGQYADGLRNSVGASGAGSGTSATTGGTSDYEAMLKTRLRTAFESPGGLALAGLSADIEVTIAANGTVVGRRLLRTSGNPAFDAAVREAMARVTTVDPPPGGRQRAFPFTFQLVTQ